MGVEDLSPFTSTPALFLKGNMKWICIWLLVDILGLGGEPIEHQDVRPAVQHAIEVGNVVHYFGPDTDLAARIIECESEGKFTARSVTGATGIWQFTQGTWRWVADKIDGPDDVERRKDPVDSTKAAAWLAYEAGWHHWHCYPHVR
jgi:hypothetical protein|tara:strand:- start:50 stop:487 length:438 start_codon:yes stop_codon:yes gene_type:complete